MAVNYIDRVLGDPDTIAFSANGNKSQRYDKVSVLQYLTLRLTGTLTLASYTAAPTKFVEAVENLVSQILLTATGNASGSISDTIKSIDFAWSHRHTQFVTSTEPTRTDVGTSNAAYNFESNCTLFLGALDVRALSSLIMQISWRDQTAMVTGGTGGTATLSNVQITVQGREIMGSALNPSRSFLKESQQTYDVTSSKLAQKLDQLPVGNTIQRIGFKGTVGSVAFADPSDTVFNNTTNAVGPIVEVKANSAYTVAKVVYQQNRSVNKRQFQLNTDMPAGYMVWQPRAPFRARNAARLDAFVDTNFTNGSTNEIQVTTVEVVQK